MAWRSSADACPRRDEGAGIAGACFVGARLAVVVVFDRFLGWPHVVIEGPRYQGGVAQSGHSQPGSTDCTAPSGPTTATN